MAKRRKGRHDEVMLIPFLDILCSLIGVLILIIVVLCVAQTQQANGRDPEEVDMAVKHKNLSRQLEEQTKAAAVMDARIASLEKTKADLLAKQAKLAELRKRLDMSGDEEKVNKDLAANLQKQVEALVTQIQDIQKGIPPLKAEIEELNRLLAERKKKPDDKPRTIVVAPSGSGNAANRRVFFVEASGPNLIAYKSKTEKISLPASSVGSNTDFLAFLQVVKKIPNASLIFLIRRDGYNAYWTGAAFAEQTVGLATTKLPLPTDGELDLNLFTPR